MNTNNDLTTSDETLGHEYNNYGPPRSMLEMKRKKRNSFGMNRTKDGEDYGQSCGNFNSATTSNIDVFVEGRDSSPNDDAFDGSGSSCNEASSSDPYVALKTKNYSKREIPSISTDIDKIGVRCDINCSRGDESTKIKGDTLDNGRNGCSSKQGIKLVGHDKRNPRNKMAISPADTTSAQGIDIVKKDVSSRNP